MSGKGVLKLKGGEQLKPAGGVKKKKKAAQSPGEGSQSQALTRAESANEEPAAAKDDITAITRGYKVQKASETEDRRTDAEKRFEARQLQLEEDRLKKLASKSHRDRVKDFNTYLEKLSEHHDIPRIGPG